MQILHEHKTIAMRDLNVAIRDSSHTFEVKEKMSSNASLKMNPVASGDNVANDLNLQKYKEELPPLVPCCEGKELQLNEELVRSGLSAISVKHDSVIHCLSMSSACEQKQTQPGLVKHRNSFRCLHRPDLKRVPYLRRMNPDELETLFRGYADLPPRIHAKTENREDAKRMLLPDENIRIRDALIHDEGPMCNVALHPILETRSCVEDVPAGMRLHGARARLYTSVLAGAKAGDQLDESSLNEEYDMKVADVSLPDEVVQLNEELQILLPPRCDDVTAESSATTQDSRQM